MTNAPMDLILEPAFDFSSAEYAELYRRSEATAFQAPRWLHHVHCHLAPALKSRQHTIVVRHRLTGDLLAVFPMVVHKIYGITTVQPADFDVCDYNAVVGTPEVLEQMARDKTLLKQLDEMLGVAALLLFRKVRKDGFDYGRLFWRSKTMASDYAAYHCQMDEDLDIWRYDTMNRKGTRKLEQLQRKLEREWPGAAFLSVKDVQLATEAIQCIRDYRVDRLEHDILRDDAYFQFYKRYALEAIQTGEAELFAVVAGGRVRAALFGLLAGGVFHGMLLGADTGEFGKYSLGIQSHFLAAQYRHGKGDRTYSLGPGDPEYKARFRSLETATVNITRPHSLLGLGVHAMYSSSFFKERIKAQMRRLNDQRQVA